MFQKWVQETFHYEICTETARLWLRSLGFFQKYHKKGVYFDGHGRQDVVEYREQFVQQLHELDRRCIYDGHEPELLEGEKNHSSRFTTMKTPMQTLIKVTTGLMIMLLF